MCCSGEESSPAQVNPIFSLTLKFIADRAALVCLIQAWFYSWPETFSRCKAESPFLWRLCYNSASMKMDPSTKPSFSPFLFINSFLEGISPAAAFLLCCWLPMETIAHACTEWALLLIPALNAEIAHSLGKWDWFRLHISVTLWGLNEISVHVHWNMLCSAPELRMLVWH